jgi:hypothetical protein
MRHTLGSKQATERRDLFFLIQGSQENEIVKHFCPCEIAKQQSVSCFVMKGSGEWKGQKVKDKSVI